MTFKQIAVLAGLILSAGLLLVPPTSQLYAWADGAHHSKAVGHQTLWEMFSRNSGGDERPFEINFSLLLMELGALWMLVGSAVMGHRLVQARPRERQPEPSTSTGFEDIASEAPFAPTVQTAGLRVVRGLVGFIGLFCVIGVFAELRFLGNPAYSQVWLWMALAIKALLGWGLLAIFGWLRHRINRLGFELDGRPGLLLGSFWAL